jgi:hypoxanthine phosphoribosyltransferase
MELLYNSRDIAKRVGELAKEIREDIKENKLTVVFVLKGAFVFCADMIRELSRLGFDVEVEYLQAKSYAGKKSTGKVDITCDVDVKGKNVVLLEDILDTGISLNKEYAILKSGQPRTLKTVVLLDKPGRRKEEFKADFVGFEIPDKFVVGYGMDCDERYRGLPNIMTLD